MNKLLKSTGNSIGKHKIDWFQLQKYLDLGMSSQKTFLDFPCFGVVSSLQHTVKAQKTKTKLNSSKVMSV